MCFLILRRLGIYLIKLTEIPMHYVYRFNPCYRIRLSEADYLYLKEIAKKVDIQKGPLLLRFRSLSLILEVGHKSNNTLKKSMDMNLLHLPQRETHNSITRSCPGSHTQNVIYLQTFLNDPRSRDILPLEKMHGLSFKRMAIYMVVLILMGLLLVAVLIQNLT